MKNEKYERCSCMIPQIYIHDLQDTAVPKPSKVSVLQIKKRPQEEDSYNVIKNMLGTALWEEEANWLFSLKI